MSSTLAGFVSRRFRITERFFGLLALLLAGLSCARAQNGPVLDLLIKNGRIIDGCGTPWFLGDVGILGGRIVRVGPQPEARAQRVIDAAGQVVAPGFIDMMGQTASPFLTNAQAGNNLLSQGVTTLLAGEGVSAAPLDPAQGKLNGWRSMREYLRLLEKKGLPMNVAQTVGHTQVRRAVLGEGDRSPTPAQMEQMQGLVREAMEAGAVGLSSALTYPPAVYASTDEIAALCQVAGSYGGRYYTHIRNEGDRLIEALDEALTVGQTAGLPVHVFHLKAAGRANWPKMDLALARIRTARSIGQEVDSDIYPYTHARISLDSFIHPRHFAEGQDAFRKQLDSRTQRAEMRQEMEEGEGWENWFRHCGFDWDKVILGQIQAPSYRRYNGKSLGEMARAAGKDPWVVFWDIVKAGASAFPETMNEPGKIAALHEEFISVCTDEGPASGAAGHPRAYGTFPRILGHYVRDLGVLSLESAVSKMTALAANQILAHDRGRLAEGQAADIVIFAPGAVRDRATFAQPSAPAEGISYVLVNGQVVLDHGQYTGALPGRVLRGPGYRPEP